MKSRILFPVVLMLALAVGGIASPKRAEAQLVTPYLVAMLAGPVSDGSSVILVKKRPNFISWETVLIACTSGAGAGLIAAGLPSVMTFVSTVGGLWNPINWSEAAIFSAYGCIVSGVGGMGGALTELLLISINPKGGHGAPHAQTSELVAN